MVARSSPQPKRRTAISPLPSGVGPHGFPGPDADQVRAAIRSEAKQHGDAVRRYTQAVRLNPRDADAWRRLGSGLVGCGRTADALAAFEASLECDATVEETFILIADTKFRLCKFADAMAYIRSMPGLARQRPELRALGAVCLDALGKPAHARVVVVRALGDFPGSQALLTLLGAMEATAGETEAAETHLRQALEAAPRNYDTLMGLGGVLDAEGKRTEARRQFERAFTVQPTRFEAIFALCSIAVLTRDHAALDHWTQLGLQIAPLHPRLLYYRARVEAQAGNRRKAEILLRASIARDPNYQAGHFAIARLLLARKQYNGATMHLEATVELDASNNQGRAAQAMLDRLQVTPS